MAKRAQMDAVKPVLDVIDKDLTEVEGFLDTLESGADKATNAIEHGLEKAADVVPEALDKTVHVAVDGTRKATSKLRDPRLIFGVVLVATAAGTAFAGYKFAKTRLVKQYEAELDTKIEEMRKFYIRRAGTIKQNYSSPKEAADALLKYQEGDKPKEGTNEFTDSAVAPSESSPIVVGETAETSVHSIFVNGKPMVEDEWDNEVERAKRTSGQPYVISADEYMENVPEHNQVTITYYEKDDVLADDQDAPIEDVERTVGSDNLMRFGHGSKDPNIVYVRNDETEVDFEVIRSVGSYAEEVHGGFQHSDSPQRRVIRAPRWGDDD